MLDFYWRILLFLYYDQINLKICLLYVRIKKIKYILSLKFKLVLINFNNILILN